MTTVGVVVPTFRRPDLLKTLLASLFAGTHLPEEVIVVDNDPLESCIADWPGEWPMQLIHAGLGLNLAGARNLGWRAARTDLCFFIDDDNVVAPDTLKQLIDAARDRSVGLLAPVIYHARNSNTVWCGGIRRSMWTTRTKFLYRDARKLPNSKVWPTDEMPDAFAVPRTVLEQVGGFDDVRFPFHYDEADLGMRIRRRGFQTVVVSDARTWHSGGTASDPGLEMMRAYDLGGRQRVALMAYARVAFHRIYSGGLQRLVAVGLYIPLYGLVVALASLRIRNSRTSRLAVLGALAMGFVKGYRSAL